MVLSRDQRDGLGWDLKEIGVNRDKNVHRPMGDRHRARSRNPRGWSVDSGGSV